MNADLEATLDEMGAAYKRFAVEFKLADAIPGAMSAAGSAAPRSRVRTAGALLAAAAFAIAFVLSVLFRDPAGSGGGRRAIENEYTVALSSAAASSVDAIIASQLADGSWGNDYLTRQNAAVLKDEEAAVVAYRRALRYLRARGLKPLSEAEMKARRAAYMQIARRG